MVIKYNSKAKNKLRTPIKCNSIQEAIEGINVINKIIYKFFYFESNSRDVISYLY